MLMILQRFGQCPLVFTFFGNGSDYELLDVSLKSWKKKKQLFVSFLPDGGPRCMSWVFMGSSSE